MMRVTNEQAKAFSICKLDCEECKASEVCYEFTGQETCGKLGVALLESRELIKEMRKVFKVISQKSIVYVCEDVRKMAREQLAKSKEYSNGHE